MATDNGLMGENVIHKSGMELSIKKSDVFIDWIIIKQIFDAPVLEINSGIVMKYAPDGSVIFKRDCFEKISGSYESVINVVSFGVTVQVSGNVGRFCRHNNLFNYNFEDVIKILNQLMDFLGLPKFTAGIKYRDKDGNIQYTGATFQRLDITCNVATGSPNGLSAFYQFLNTFKLGRQKNDVNPDTHKCIIGGGSRFKTITVYNKAEEMRKHLMPKPAMKKPENENGQYYIMRELEEQQNEIERVKVNSLIDYAAASGIVRIELRGLGKFLRENNIYFLADCSHDKISDIYIENIKSGVLVNMGNFKLESRLDSEILSQMTNSVRGAYDAWLHGESLRTKYSKAQYYKIRRKLKALGIDISIPYFQSSKYRVEPKHQENPRGFEFIPLSPPDWYVDMYMPFNPDITKQMQLFA